MIEARLTTKEDMPLLFEILREPGISGLIFHDPYKLTLEALPGFLLQTKPGTTASAFTFIMDGEVAGLITFNDIHPVHRSVSIGMVALGKKFQGRRCGFKMWRFATDYCFKTLNLNRICGLVLPDNRVVMGIYKMLGGSCEGIAKEAIYKDGQYVDVHLYSLLKSEWKEGGNAHARSA